MENLVGPGPGPGPGRVLVRDTTDRDGGTLAFTAESWTRFTDGLR